MLSCRLRVCTCVYSMPVHIVHVMHIGESILCTYCVCYMSVPIGHMLHNYCGPHCVDGVCVCYKLVHVVYWVVYIVHMLYLMF